MNQTINFPVEINEFLFNEDGFTSKGRKYTYESIASLNFQIINTSINFSKDETYIFAMRTQNDELVSISISDAAFTINKKKVAEKKRNLLNIANHINSLTFDRRFKSYLNEIQSTGRLQYKIPDGSMFRPKLTTVFIYSNGDVSLAGKTVNLKRASEAGTLKFGTAYGLGCDRTINPHEISINEKAPILGGWAEGTGSLRFDASWDSPMIFEILKAILLK